VQDRFGRELVAWCDERLPSARHALLAHWPLAQSFPTGFPQSGASPTVEDVINASVGGLEAAKSLLIRCVDHRIDLETQHVTFPHH